MDGRLAGEGSRRRVVFEGFFFVFLGEVIDVLFNYMDWLRRAITQQVNSEGFRGF